MAFDVTTRDAGKFPEREYLPTPTIVSDERDYQIGEHFWARMDEGLVVIMLNENGYFYVCGGWECPVDNFEFVSKIELPEGFTSQDIYHLS